MSIFFDDSSVIYQDRFITIFKVKLEVKIPLHKSVTFRLKSSFWDKLLKIAFSRLTAVFLLRKDISLG